jgi:hypothetical protein
MTSQEAKEILKLYRPTADADDRSFAEALAEVDRDPELKQWFENHCAVYLQLRSKFQGIAVPEGLKEQIIAERKVHIRPQWQRIAVGIAAVAVILFVVGRPVAVRWMQDRAARSFPAFLDNAASIASWNYGMDTNTDNLEQIRALFAARQGIADYQIPPNLQSKATAVGCVASNWRGKPVSLLCFRSGKPLPNNQKSDLWLFVVDRNTPVGTPAPAEAPQIKKVNRFTMASWTSGNKTYVLAADGDEEFLKKYL